MNQSKPRHAKIFHRAFIVVLLFVITLFLVIYFYSVPLIKQKVFEIEMDSSRTALNNIYEIARRMHTSLEDYKKLALQTQEQKLKIAVEFTETFLDTQLKEAQLSGLDLDKTRERAFATISKFRFGNDNYVWIADYNSVLVSHPDPAYRKVDVSYVAGTDGETVVPNIFAHAVQKREGFYQYLWQRPGDATKTRKVAYVKSFPEWQLVIGSSVNHDEIEKEVSRRHERALEELRDALQQTRVAKTGYFFIFDSHTNMLIHPNANIDGMGFENLKNPLTQHSIADELIKVADTGKEHHYKWDKPTDPGNYIYEKLSLVRYMAGFDWYISSSIYLEELQSSSELLGKRILTIAIVALVGLLVAAYFLLSRITQPIERLAATASRIQDGDLSAQSGVVRDDEIGILADSFDSMVFRLRNSITTLDSEVRERTKELAATEERLRLILDALPAQVSYCDNNFRYLFVNRAYAEQFHQEKQEIVGKHFREVLGEAMYAEIYGRLLQVLSGESVAYEYSFDRADKVVITKRRLIPEFGENNRITGILSLSLDITAEKEAERQLNEAQRMKAVGQLAGGMAHDFNNLLTIIMGNLMLAKSHYAATEGLDSYLDPAIGASRRGAEITHRMLAFSRRESLSPDNVNISEVLDDTKQLLDGSLPSNIHLYLDNKCSNCYSYVDQSHLENALVNLALNAKDAMPSGGAIRVGLQVREIDQETIYDEQVKPGRYIEITVADTGVGFSQEAQLAAFEPFFTTKSGGANSGLGLSMVYGFVKQSDGYIKIDSSPNQGSRIYILLQCVDEPGATGLDANSSMELQTDLFKDKLFLLVEDDNDVRRVVREQLTQLGINVVEAEDSEEAIALIGNLPNIDGMISDIMLCDSIDGFDLARRIHHINPETLILLISGYAHEVDDQGVKREFPILRKPFDQDTLLKSLREAAHQVRKKADSS